MTHQNVVRARKIAALKKRGGYSSIDVDYAGRIEVEVDARRFTAKQKDLLRRVWPGWPFLVSDRWKPPKTTPDEQQFQVHSREY